MPRITQFPICTAPSKVHFLGLFTRTCRIVENCGNTLILRCSASEGGGTARFASKLIGEPEVLREQVTNSRGGGYFFASDHRSVSTSVHHVTESAVLPSEIEQLPDLAGISQVCLDAGVEEGAIKTRPIESTGSTQRKCPRSHVLPSGRRAPRRATAANARKGRPRARARGEAQSAE
jgi:hypothetical protein